uniref:Uncharacterized protein n=1 Tax=Avena sativa TaxID=4498 RepID=A0ACD6APX9_AVESA
MYHSWELCSYTSTSTIHSISMTSAEELQLLGAASGVSPYVIRVQMALAVKGLSYEYIPEDVQRKSDLLAASNPVHRKVPVLLHAGRPVCESLVLLEYLDDAFPTNNNGSGAPSVLLLPVAPRPRALARFWAAFVDGTLFPSCLGMLKRTAPQERAEMVEATLRALGHLEGVLAEVVGEEAPFFGGRAVGFLDIALGCYLPWLEVVGRLAGVAPPLLDAAGRTPRLAAWAERFRAAEPVGALLPAADKVEEYVTTVLYPKWNAAAAAAASAGN